MQVVALGAAVQAGMLEGQMGDMMVMDVWQAALMRALAGRAIKDDPNLTSQLAGQRAGPTSKVEGAEDVSTSNLQDWGPEAADLGDGVELGPDNADIGA